MIGSVLAIFGWPLKDWIRRDQFGRIFASIQVSARRFCQKILVSPSILSLPCSGWAIAQMSLYMGGGVGSTNLLQEFAGARRANCHPMRLAFGSSATISILPLRTWM